MIIFWIYDLCGGLFIMLAEKMVYNARGKKKRSQMCKVKPLISGSFPVWK